MALADVVVAQLTPPQAQRLWTTLGQPLAEFPGTELALSWEELLNRCLAKNTFLDLLKVLVYVCSTLRDDPLILRLKTPPSD